MSSYEIDIKHGGIVQFMITRRAKRNAINYEVMEGLSMAMDTVLKDDAGKALVITGEGEQAFCSGGDLAEFQHLKSEQEAYGMLSKMGAILFRLTTLQKPTIAMLNGTAIGGGCELAAACDFRIAKKGIKAGFVQGNLGITTGWGGASILFEKILPSDALKILTEARTYPAESLKRIGFIQEVAEKLDLEVLLDFITDKQPDVLSAYKQALVSKWHSSDLKGRMNEEIKRCAKLWASEEHHKAVDRFLNK
ncbi:enoyl-CoA hydratase/isomerase family protein [Falsibacillus albus]|uniref:Enoyl-CoA hydratase/isomerase family protein n=1 Tax=Falsibacillus albus TaxID=2478915 RepID=A0A3L7JZU8_9BACI|nr:enoyl-CoA hydratase/isomerase family protein [Falsibacillus albus]RLQ95845.1 enoyl-CoA hydratase/isomerase family protein [Falsibacillus albus]